MISVYVLMIALLTLAWCILGESFSLFTIGTGVLVGILCALFTRKYLPLSKISGISVLKLLTYPFYMLAQIYIAAFSNIKMILTNATAGIIELKTSLSNDFLRVLLSHCATLTPGTVTLDTDGDTITLLSLIGKDSSLKDADKNVRKIEKMLLWAEKDSSLRSE